MSETIPTLAQMTEAGRHAISVQLASREALKPARWLGHRRISGHSNEAARLSVTDANRQRKLANDHVRQLGLIYAAARAGDGVALTASVKRTLNSRAAKASALMRIADAQLQAFSNGELANEIAQLNVFLPCNEPVRLNAVAKGDGAKRPTLQFGQQHKARQLMVLDVLRASGVGNEYDHNFKGFGPKRAIYRIKEAIELGYHWWLTADIKHCFASVKPGHLLGTTPIPDVVIKRVAFLPENVPVLHSDYSESMYLEQAACGGLPLGSITSSPLASAVIGREMRAVMSAYPGAPASFADDLAIGARTRDVVEAIQLKLGERFASLSGGPLMFKYLKITHASMGVDFIQRRLRLKRWNAQVEVSVTPSPTAFERLRKKLLVEYGGEAGIINAWDYEPDQIRQRVESWGTALNWKMQPEWWETVLTSFLA